MLPCHIVIFPKLTGKVAVHNMRIERGTADER